MKQTSEKRPHVSVMAQEMLDFFADKKIGTFFEGTLGAGGHAYKMLEAHPEIERYIGCDRDPEALEEAKAHLAPWKEKITFIQGNFANLDEYLTNLKLQKIDGFFLIWGCHLCN